MGRRSSVCSLTEDQRDDILTKWRSGQYSLEQLAKHASAKVSRSALHRYLQNSDELYQIWTREVRILKRDVAPRQYRRRRLTTPFSQARDPSPGRRMTDVSLGSRLKSRWRGLCAMLPRPVVRTSPLHPILGPRNWPEFPIWIPCGPRKSRIIPE